MHPTRRNHTATAPTSRLGPLAVLARLPGYPTISLAVLAMGLADSFSRPYLSLFGVNAANMTPLALGVFMTLLSVSSILVSALLGRWSDKQTSRKPAVLLAVTVAAIGFTLLPATTHYLLLIAIATVFLGPGAAAFPQLFAFARTQIAAATAKTSDHGITTLRSIYSLAWVIGPALGAVILARAEYTGLFLATAASYILAALLTTRIQPRAKPGPTISPTPAVPARTPTSRRPIPLITLSFTLNGAAMSMGAIAFPLQVTHVLGGTSSDVGLLVGLCALLEIPVMLALVLSRRTLRSEPMIIAGFASFILYFTLVVLAPSVAFLIVAQAIRAVGIGITAGLGITYFQELLPERLGAATALYANTINAGSLLAGVLFGVFAQAFGYQAVFLASAALTGLACALLYTAKRQSET